MEFDHISSGHTCLQFSISGCSYERCPFFVQKGVHLSSLRLDWNRGPRFLHSHYSIGWLFLFFLLSRNRQTIRRNSSIINKVGWHALHFDH